MENTDENTFLDIIAENERRNAALKYAYDPLRGVGCCGERVAVEVEEFGKVYVPKEMVDSEPREVFDSVRLYNRTRIKYDFEYWCATCATVRDKVSGRNVRFVLNAPQRRVLATIERLRVSHKPIRIIMLKARQWGGSTLVLMYMAWIQIVLRKNWNSLICGHKRNTSKAIKGMYTKLLRNYPKEYLEEGCPQLKFKSYEGSSDTQEITGRDCIVIIGSAHSEDMVRGFDIAMAHLSEVAFWPQSPHHSPEDVVRSVDGTVLLEPMTMIAFESTANGAGSFFHNEWLRAKRGESGYEAIFVPWHEIEIYRSPVGDARELWESLDDYERGLWNEGCTLEMINWYHNKRRNYLSHNMLMTEFPTTDIEAFACTSHCIFDLSKLDSMRKHCRQPVAVGEMEDVYKGLRTPQFCPTRGGNMKVWEMPQPTGRRNRYLASVDVGGNSENADFSVISVIDRGENRDDVPTIVAQWRGHTDHDLLVWKAAQIARFYNNALLVIESNSLEADKHDARGLNFILETVKTRYPNIYIRKSKKIGFQTNKETKGELVNNLIALVRDGGYIERDHDAIDELSWYEQKPRGNYGAIDGKHDDIVMSRAIGLLIACQLNWNRCLSPSDFVQ